MNRKLGGTLPEIRQATLEWESETTRLALRRARRVANFTDRLGSQTAAARHLGVDQSTVNKMIKKARATSADA